MAQSKRAKLANYLCRLNFRSPLGSASPFLFTLIPFCFSSYFPTCTFGLGDSVRPPSLKLHHRFHRQPRLIRLARIPLRFRECLVAEYRHYLVRGAPRLGKTPTSSLAKAMRLTIERKPSSSDRATEPLTETANRERLGIFRVDDRHLVTLGGGQNCEQVSVERDRELAPGLLLHNSNRFLAHIRPGHAVHVASALTGIKRERESKPLLGTNRPMLFKYRNFGVGPRTNFIRLRPLDPKRGSCLSQPISIACRIRTRSILRIESAAPGFLV